jgi:acyl-CoA reductase-like NAD-dependent aldehyde dehydrogenase
LAGAIAAGNCVIVKHSELSSNSSATLTKLMAQYLDHECYHSFETDAAGSKELLKNKFDYIFFTGSAGIARSVMDAAAKHLTPVTLELGGKNPVYIHDSSNIEMAAERILFGKCMTLGQVCLAPDYILCSKKVEEEFLRVVPIILNRWFGPDWKNSRGLGRIISNGHFLRLKRLLTDGGGRIALGGSYDESDKWISPTIIVDVNPSDQIMNDEIFGPILPILLADSVEDAIAQILTRPKSLAAYVFTKKSSIANKFIKQTSSGGVAVNDVVLHTAHPGVPFGGVGESGMGNCHWKYSFETFSHKKAVVRYKQCWLHHKVESPMRFPLYKADFMDRVMTMATAGFCLFNLMTCKSGICSHLFVFAIGIILSCIFFLAIYPEL